MPGIQAAPLFRLLVCFFAGAIPFAVLATLGTGVNILKFGSGNPGFNNVLRLSKWRAVATLLGDVGKGFLVVWLFSQPGQAPLAGWLYGFAAVLGHCYSPFLRFNGGKGIATSGGVMLVLYPGWTGLALALFAAMRATGALLKWKEAGTISSLSAWLFFTLVMFTFVRGPEQAVMAALMTVFLAWRHKKNFQNLFTPRTPDLQSAVGSRQLGSRQQAGRSIDDPRSEPAIAGGRE